MATQTTVPVPPPPTTPPPVAATPAPVPTPVATPTPASPKVNPLENTMLLVVTRKWVPQTKTISNKVLTSTAQSSMISANKKLFDSFELKAIASNQVKVDEFLKRRSTPIPLRSGHHLLGDDLFTEVESTLMEFLAEHDRLVDKFVAVYDQAVTKARTLLGDQFNQNDYPSKEIVKGYFHFSWQYFPFGINDKLQKLSKEVAERKAQQFQAEIIRVGDAANALLTQQMQKLVEHLVDRLTPTPGDDGELKRKTFRDKMLDPMNDFLAVFDARNLGQNEQLKSTVDKVKAMMSGVSVGQLKENEELRKKMEAQINEVKKDLDKMIIEQPLRSISFED